MTHHDTSTFSENKNLNKSIKNYRVKCIIANVKFAKRYLLGITEGICWEFKIFFQNVLRALQVLQYLFIYRFQETLKT